MAFMQQSSSYYEADQEMYQSSMGNYMGSSHMSNMGSGRMSNMGSGRMSNMGRHMGSSQMGYGSGNGFSANTEYSSYSSMAPSQSYGFRSQYGGGGGGMMGSSGYVEEESSYYASNNSYNPCNKYY